MLTPKALAQLRRAHDEATQHLAFLERCAALPEERKPSSILLATPGMIAAARQKVLDLERRWLDHAEQLALFAQRQFSLFTVHHEDPA
jgi:hypothetical protein